MDAPTQWVVTRMKDMAYSARVCVCVQGIAECVNALYV